MIREMTTEQLHQFYDLARCPFCGGSSFLAGPKGGLMQNIECGPCGARINIVPGPYMGYSPPPIGQVIREPVRNTTPGKGDSR